jgi:cell division transport system permease protein
VNRLKLVGSEALRSITANISTTVAATLTVLIGMFLVGMLVGFTTYANSWGDQKKGELLVKVFFCVEQTCSGKEATTKQINAVADRLEANPRVKSFVFVSKEDALKREQKKHPDLYAQLPANPLPDAFEVTPTSGEQTEALANSLEDAKLAGVQKVTFGAKTAHRILEVARLIEVISLVAVIVLLAAATVLIANTIRLSIFARRREVEIMKLVGASNWFVRGPFMLEGVITGFVGAVLAIVLLVLGREFVLPSFSAFNDASVHAIPFALNALILIGLGLVLGAAGSALTLRRFLRV